jgi:hypothetical protein
MNPVFHIITPVTRIFNLERIAHGLRATGDYDTHWHISFDHRLLGVGESGHAVRNRIIDTIPVCSENWIFMLDDDTLPHPDLLNVVVSKIIGNPKLQAIVVSQDRGNGQVLRAAVGNLKVGQIDMGQAIIRRSLIGDKRVPLRYDGDGFWLVEVLHDQLNVLYLDEALSWYNKLRQ